MSLDRNLDATYAAEELPCSGVPEVSPPPLTYSTLLDALRAIDAGASSDQAVDSPVTRNRRTALRGFMRSVDKRDLDRVGNEMADGFAAALCAYQAWEKQRGTAVSTVRSRCSHLRRVQQLAAKHVGTTPTFAALLDRAIAASGCSMPWLEQKSGIGALSLGQWRRGTASPGRLRKHFQQLETSLGPRAGILLAALPSRASLLVGYGVTRGTATTTFRANVKARLEEQPFALHSASEALQDEWRQPLAYKTADLPALRRERRAKWRAKPARMSKPLKPAWCCTLANGQVTATTLLGLRHRGL